MTNSRSRGRRSLCIGHLPTRFAAALALLVGFGGMAAAQVGQPRNLLPSSPGDEGTPETAPPAPDTSAPPAPGTTTAPKGFEINTLDELGTDYAGPLEASKGGFATDMWRGTDRVKVERLLPLLKPTTSPALADLTRRLLLSNAGAPAGKGSGANLLPPRAKLLADMGLAPEALALLKLQHPEQRDAPAARMLAELSWRTGDLDGGCAAVTDALPKVKIDSFWQEAERRLVGLAGASRATNRRPSSPALTRSAATPRHRSRRSPPSRRSIWRWRRRPICRHRR